MVEGVVEGLTQTVHVALQYIPGPESSYMGTSGPKYMLYTYMDLSGNQGNLGGKWSLGCTTCSSGITWCVHLYKASVRLVWENYEVCGVSEKVIRGKLPT